MVWEALKPGNCRVCSAGLRGNSRVERQEKIQQSLTMKALVNDDQSYFGKKSRWLSFNHGCTLESLMALLVV